MRIKASCAEKLQKDISLSSNWISQCVGLPQECWSWHRPKLSRIKLRVKAYENRALLKIVKIVNIFEPDWNIGIHPTRTSPC